ncbi:MAG: cation diffusion facilitator family transporter [Gemmatimonadota bacterium]
MAGEARSKRVIYAGLAGNILVAVTKGIAAVTSGSSAMLSETVHSVVDSGNELLLLYGLRRAARPPDHNHPFGHGRELYFWSFMVALLVFALGAGVSLYEGVLHLRHPVEISHPNANYVVLGLSFLFEGGSWLVGWRQFRRAQGSAGFWEAFRRSKDPPTFMVLFEDTAALVGIVIAVAATYLATTLKLPWADGLGSILIGVVLTVTALLLVRESKSLLIGEPANRAMTDSIVHIAQAESSIAKVNGVVTVQMAPEQVVVALSLEFGEDLRTSDIEEHVSALERKIRIAHPSVVALFIKPQTGSAFREARRRRQEVETSAGFDNQSPLRADNQLPEDE